MAGHQRVPAPVDHRNYCVGLATRAEEERGQQARMIWYATLALLRCVSSSPAAAVRALTTRLTGQTDPASLPETGNEADDRVFDGTGEGLSQSDIEPAAALDEEAALLKGLISTAEKLSGTKGDPKLAALVSHLRGLLKEGFKPVVFCRYVATAHYVASHLAKEFPAATIDAVTGEYSPEERAERFQALGENESPVMVARRHSL